MFSRSKCQRLALSSILFLSFSSSALASYGQTQYIFYNTTLSGVYSHSSSSPSLCPDYYFDDITNFNARVGVNPPWDQNDFWFGLLHVGNLVDDSSCEDLCTSDPIYDFFFESAAYECFYGNGLCEEGIVVDPVYFVGLQLLNLNDSTVVEYSTLGPNNEHGYTVVGDNSSWVSNDTVTPYFNFQRPSNYSAIDGCVDLLEFQWNSSTPFTYALNFTNSTISGSMSISAPYGSITLSYAGDRVDHATSPDDYHIVNPLDFDNFTYTPVELSNSSSSLPVFEFINGDAIAFVAEDNGLYAVSAASTSLGHGFGGLSIFLWTFGVAALALLI